MKRSCKAKLYFVKKKDINNAILYVFFQCSFRYLNSFVLYIVRYVLDKKNSHK